MTGSTPEKSTRRMLKEAQAWADDLPPVMADGLPAPRDLEAEYRDWHAKQPKVRLVSVERSDVEIRPGDIVTWGLDGIKHGRPSDYGHVVVVRGRGHGKTALLARLKALLAGK